MKNLFIKLTIAKILVIAATVVFIISMSSCSTSGYGCKGNESWSKMERRINKKY